MVKALEGYAKISSEPDWRAADACVVQSGNAKDACREVAKPSGDVDPRHQHTKNNEDGK